MLQVNSGNFIAQYTNWMFFRDLIKIVFKILFYKMIFNWEVNDDKGEREKESKKISLYNLILWHLFYTQYFPLMTWLCLSFMLSLPGF